jgi:hypothetical protein
VPNSKRTYFPLKLPVMQEGVKSEQTQRYNPANGDATVRLLPWHVKISYAANLSKLPSWHIAL